MRRIRIAGRVRMLAAVCLMLPLAGCEGILDVSNPGAINVDQLNNAALIDVQVTGVIRAAADNLAGQASGSEEAIIMAPNFLTDELVTGLNWEDWARVNQRIVNWTEGPVDPTWSVLSRQVRLGEKAIEQLDTLSANPTSDERLALMEALTGYGYVWIGETYCEAVINTAEQVDDPDYVPTKLQPQEVFPLAIPHFQRAITIAQAAGDADVENMAHVGLMRAYLNLNQLANVVSEFASVTAGFEYWMEYSDASGDQENNLYYELHGSNFTLGVHPNFLQGTWDDQDIIDTQTDPRIQHASRWRTGHNATTHLYKPYQGLRYSEYSGETLAPTSGACPACTGATEGNGDDGDVLLVQRYTNVLLADYVEAQHHYYEALARQGGSDAAVLTFVNARRAVGNQAPVASSGAALQADLREQRSRDLYMGGFRLGDLRRWIRDGVGDFFPTGAHVVTEWGDYGDWTCLSLPIEEYDGNPNLERPTNPLDPPAWP